ncbi:GPI-anchored wall transfer protein 1-like [Homarus americanus]|uniref:GPI-anchored wall transfer protein 1-like n=1 Tax=Homarus americanus TaxID=6706 RepID=UPI001C45FEE7|nr:GPI-anchored wall transfer protein 1-like [Homarus americanus]
MNSARESHEAFVSGHSGSSAPDLILAVTPAFPASALAVLIIRGRAGWLWYFLDSFLIVVPLTLSFTVLANYTLELSTLFTILVGVAISLTKPEKITVHNDANNKKHLGCVTSLRSLLSLATCIAILGVDFHSFPRRFAKTEEYGYSLMDVGAAGFVVINGIVETKKRPYYRYIMRDGVILSVLGVLRLVLVRAANYQHHVTEYGVHANFFFTLAFIKFTCSWWVCHLKCLGSAMVALFLCLCHHLYLTVGNGGPWTLSDIPRDTLLLANREWLVSMPGYVALYFLGASLGAFVFNRSGNTKLTRPLIVITLLCGGCLAGLHHYVDLPSRRLGNPTFAGLVIFFVLVGLTSFSLIEERLAEVFPGLSSVPHTFQAINHQPLLFFLLSNVSTGLINKSINTLEVMYPWDVSIIAVYATLLVSVMYFIFITNIR